MKRTFLTIAITLIAAVIVRAAVGDTVTVSDARYAITSDSTLTLCKILEAPRIVIPDSIVHDGTAYAVTAIADGFHSLYPDSGHIEKIDFSRAVHITSFPQSARLTVTTIDSLTLPPHITSLGRFYTYDIGHATKLGINRLFTSGSSRLHLEDFCFEGYLPLKEIDFGSSIVDTIPLRAFEWCYSLEKVSLPKSLKVIFRHAFNDCYSLRELTLPPSLLLLDWLSLSNTGLLSLHIPASTYLFSQGSYIGSLQTFTYSNVHLSYYDIEDENPYYKSSGGVIFSKSGHSLLYAPIASHTGHYTVPDDVDSIMTAAFLGAMYRYRSIESDTIEKFDTLGIIRHITFSPKLRYLGFESFNYSFVETLENFGSTAVSNIPKNCFAYSDLNGIELPIELSSIEEGAFSSCLRLDSVRFLGSVVSSIGEAAFSRCTSLDSLDISAQTRLKTISASLCWGDSSLRSVKLPTSIDSIGNYAFYGCVSLSEIEVPVLDPITIDGSVFSGVDKSSCRLIIPAPSIDRYRAAPVWNDFLRIESGDLLTITVLSADSLMGGVTGTGVYRYGDSPYIAANPARGYRFTRWSDGSTEQYRRVALTSDSTLTAYFELNPEFQYRVSVRTADRTMGSVSPTTAYARHGETVTITATPATGYRFTLWSDSVTANPRDIIVTRDTVLTAHFAPAAPVTPDTFAVTLLCDSAMGTVSGSGRYPEGTAAILTATPREGYAFTRWEDNHGLTFTDNPLTLTVTCDTTLTALFREDGTGHSPATADSCAAWVTPDGTLRVRCPGCRLMELRAVTGLTLYSGAPADIPLPMPGIYILTLDGRTIKIIRP